VQEYLSGWDLWAADPPGVLRPWKEKEFLPKGIHDIWCRRNSQSPWLFQLMLAEDDGDRWIFRRDTRITVLIKELGKYSNDGIPYLAPEIQLLYKSKEPREKDEADFAQILPFMDESALKWLTNALISLAIERFFRAFNRFYKIRYGFSTVISAKRELILFLLVYVFIRQPGSGKAPIESIMPEASRTSLYQMINDPFGAILGLENVKKNVNMADFQAYKSLSS